MLIKNHLIMRVDEEDEDVRRDAIIRSCLQSHLNLTFSGELAAAHQPFDPRIIYCGVMPRHISPNIIFWLAPRPHLDLACCLRFGSASLATAFLF